MKTSKILQCSLLLFPLAAFPLSAQGNGKGAGKGGGSAVALQTTHSDVDSALNPVDIYWTGFSPISEASHGHEITFDKHGTYKMTMQCADPGDCPESFAVQLTPVSGSCPPVAWPAARMSIRVDDVESVDMGTVARSGWAQVRELDNGEAVGVLYTLNWDGQDIADLIDVSGDGIGASWMIETQGDGLANMRVPAAKGNKTVICGVVRASFSLQTEIIE